MCTCPGKPRHLCAATWAEGQGRKLLQGWSHFRELPLRQCQAEMWGQSCCRVPTVAMPGGDAETRAQPLMRTEARAVASCSAWEGLPLPQCAQVARREALEFNACLSSVWLCFSPVNPFYLSVTPFWNGNVSPMVVSALYLGRMRLGFLQTCLGSQMRFWTLNF